MIKWLPEEYIHGYTMSSTEILYVFKQLLTLVLCSYTKWLSNLIEATNAHRDTDRLKQTINS